MELAIGALVVGVVVGIVIGYVLAKKTSSTEIPTT